MPESTMRPSAATPTRRRQPDLVPYLVLLGTAAFVLVSVSIYVGLNGKTDFLGFFESGKAWNEARDPYARFSGNLNPPLVSALFFRPLALLPFAPAFLVWSGISIAVWLWLIQQIPAERRWWWLMASAVWGGTWIGIKVGQVGLVFAGLMGAVYLADRRGAWLQAGALLGFGLAWKPFVGLIAVVWLLKRRFFALLACAVTFVAAIGIQIGLWGWPLFAKWLSELRGTTAFNLLHSANASLNGLSAQLGFGGAIGTIAAVTVALIGLVIAYRGTGASAWLAALSASLLASPLGWTYYLPILLLPLADRWEESRWQGRWVVMALLLVPPVPAIALPDTVKMLMAISQTVALVGLLIYSAMPRHSGVPTAAGV